MISLVSLASMLSLEFLLSLVFMLLLVSLLLLILLVSSLMSMTELDNCLLPNHLKPLVENVQHVILLVYAIMHVTAEI